LKPQKTEATMRHIYTTALDESVMLIGETRQVCMTSRKLILESQLIHRRAADLSRAIAAAQEDNLKMRPITFRDHDYPQPHDPYWWLRRINVAT
jgi:hypothetical protein